MRTLNSKTSIALLFFGLGIVFCTFLLFRGCDINSSQPGEKIVQPKEIKNEASANEAIHLARIAELEKKNAGLQQELKSTKEQLVQIKAKIRQRESNIKKLIEPKGFLAKDLLQKVKPVVIADTGVSPCDSLVREVSSYIHENQVKDSLYEAHINKQDSVIAGKDSVIELRAKLYKDLQSFFDQSLLQQEKLIKENIQLRKQLKRQKTKGNLLNIGALVLSALAVNYIVNP